MPAASPEEGKLPSGTPVTSELSLQALIIRLHFPKTPGWRDTHLCLPSLRAWEHEDVSSH